MLGLEVRYAEPWRRYHTLEHVHEVLAVVGELSDRCDDVVTVGLAAWFHDAVYDPLAPAGENERASAVLALELLPEEVAAQVARLVLLTAAHVVEPGDADGAVLCDADLAVLGSGPERYERYAADVRAEYAVVPDDRWRLGRAGVLEGFLARPAIFATEALRAELEATARANLEAELVSLRRR